MPWAPSKNLQSITLYVPNISLDDRVLFKEFFNALLSWQPPPIRYIKLGFACVETLIEEVKLAQAAEQDPSGECFRQFFAPHANYCDACSD